MKVIIELNDFIKLEFHNDCDMEEQVRIWFVRGLEEHSAAVKIEDLKLALRKLTAK